MGAFAGKRMLTVASATIGLVALLMLFAPQSQAAFQSGVVKVSGDYWSLSNPEVDVALDTIANPDDGQAPFSTKAILEAAESSADGQYNVDSIPGITVRGPKGSVVGCSGDQVRDGDEACPVFYSTDSATYMEVKGGNRVTFNTSVPVIRIDRPKDMVVTVIPKSRQISSGNTVNFVVDVANSIGNLTYKWSFGDGTPDQTSGRNEMSHKFTGNGKKYSVIVTVTSDANSREYYGSSLIIVGKIVKKKPKKDKPKDEKEDEPEDTGNYDSGYDYGYGGGYYDGGYGGGTGTGSGSPSTASPSPSQPDQQKEPVQPQEDSGETVSGQLIDPTQIATVVPSTETPSTGTEEAAPEENSGGGGLSDGAKTALGIGALLGLGGLAEAGAFTGAFRRFRFRL